MENTQENIGDIDEVEFSRVYNLVKDIRESEEHFNNLSSKYKMTASTWLLSIFAGIGFVLINKLEPKFLFISLISFAGSLGIYLLWLTDLKVYQQLLSANFVEGLKMEKKYKWLPAIRQNMIDSQNTGTVINNLSWFYIIGIITPLLIGAYCSIKYVIEWNFLGAFLLAIGFSVLAPIITNKLISKSEEINLKDYLVKNKYPVISFKGLLWVYGFVVFLSLFFSNFADVLTIIGYRNVNTMTTLPLKDKYDYLAPDSSEIRLLLENNHGGMAHCVLPVGKVSKAVRHKTVEEIWYIIEGKGEIWRKNEEEEEIVEISQNISLTIPVGTSFQFRNTGNIPLKIIIVTMPPWPGADEAEFVGGYWE